MTDFYLFELFHSVQEFFFTNLKMLIDIDQVIEFSPE